MNSFIHAKPLCFLFVFPCMARTAKLSLPARILYGIVVPAVSKASILLPPYSFLFRHFSSAI